MRGSKGSRRSSSSKVGKHFLLRPRLAIALLLFFCWFSDNGMKADARIHLQKNIRLRAPNPLSSQTRVQTRGGQMRPGLQDQSSDDTEFIGVLGGVGNLEPIQETRKKKNCGVSGIAARSLIGTSMKRSYFANTPEEVEEKIQEENKRRKRDLGEVSKKNDIADGPLPWTCLTKYAWEDMGADHYPRFVRTAECKSRVCFNGFFRCKPRRYKAKILKRATTGQEAASCEEDDVSLPDSLAANWRFITVTINLCCDCTGRIPATEGAAAT